MDISCLTVILWVPSTVLMCSVWLNLYNLPVVGTHGCVLTDHEHTVPEGSDVHLSCDFSSCLWLQGRSVSLEWEFNKEVVLIFHYANMSVIKWPNVKFLGNITAGDFSVLLRSVTSAHNGTYLCRFRPPHSRIIYKNYTWLTVIRRRPADPSPSTMLPICFIVGLLLVIITVAAWWLRCKLTVWKNTVQRKDEVMKASRGDSQPPQRNQDIYVTLQRCNYTPPPSPQKEGIYVTMVSHGWRLYFWHHFFVSAPGQLCDSLYSLYPWKLEEPRSRGLHCTVRTAAEGAFLLSGAPRETIPFQRKKVLLHIRITD
ncbi:hypothetical protein GN956_G8563, partial [Arapaima gigas]